MNNNDLISKTELLKNLKKYYSGSINMEKSDSMISFKNVCKIINTQQLPNTSFDKKINNTKNNKSKKGIKINREAKEYLLNYLQNWLDDLSTYSFSFRKGIVWTIYNKIDSIPVDDN